MRMSMRCPHQNMDCEMLSAYEQSKRYALDLHCALSVLRKTKQDIEEAYQDTVRRLVMAVEYRDNETGAHVMRLGRLSGMLAAKAGCDADFVKLIGQAAPMHDVGKIGIPDSILLKPGPLTAEEFDVMRTHTVIGAELLDKAVSEVMRMARSISLTHHERFNGRGYPAGLSGEDIPLEGRIVALVDVFDALSSKRPYKEAYPLERVLRMLEEERGQHFDPWLLDLFVGNMDEVLAIREEVNALGNCSFSQSIEAVVRKPTITTTLAGGTCKFP